MEEETNKEQEKEQAGDNIDLAATEKERALKRAYRIFLIPGLPQADIDGYVDRAKSHIKMLIKKKLKEIQGKNDTMVKIGEAYEISHYITS